MDPVQTDLHDLHVEVVILTTIFLQLIAGPPVFVCPTICLFV